MAEMICTRCHTVGKPKSVAPIGCAGELVAWAIAGALAVVVTPIVLLIPLAMSLYALGAGKKACRSCMAVELVRTDSPVGKKLLAERGGKTSGPSRADARDAMRSTEL